MSEPFAIPKSAALRFAALAVMLGGAGPLAAEAARTSLAVSATVVPACTASTRPQADSADPVALACSRLGQGGASISRTGDAGLPRIPARRDSTESKSSGESVPAGISYVTITY